MGVVATAPCFKKVCFSVGIVVIILYVCITKFMKGGAVDDAALIKIKYIIE